MRDKILSRPKTAAFAAGIAAVFALPPYHQAWLLFVCFGLLGVLLNNAVSGRRAFALGYWFGFGFFAAGLSWIANALALDIVSFGWLIPFALALGGAFFGLFVAFPALGAHYFRGYFSRCIAFGVFWALFEWIRSFLLTGFPWNLLGSVLAFDHRLLQPASVFGTYGLSLAVVIASMLPAAAFVAPKRRNAAAGIVSSFVILAAIAGYGYCRTKQLDDGALSDISIRIVQPSIPQSLKWNYAELEKNFADYVAMSQDEGFAGKNVVIWGETASTFPVALDRAHFYQMLPAVPDNGYLIAGSIDYFPDEDDRWLPVNAGLILRHGRGIAGTYAKSHLVPFGEYIPFRKFLPDGLRPVTKVISDFKAGDGVKTFSLEGLPPFGLLICYEIIFPRQVADAHNRPQWLINLTNDGWYGRSSGPYQHLVTARLRAVEEGLTVVRAANSGVSAVISRTGRVIKSLGLHERGNLDFTLPRQLDVSTPYAKRGNLYFFLLSLLLVASALLLSAVTTENA